MGDRKVPMRNFHDAEMLSVRIDGKDIELGFRDIDGLHYRLTLKGVRSFVVDNFLSGNIIFELLIQELSDFDQREIDELLPIEMKIDLDKLRRIGGGQEFKLIRVEPSYGAVLRAVAADCELKIEA